MSMPFAPHMYKFDLEPGDVIVARDEYGSSWKWKVLSLHKHIFCVERFGKGHIQRAFRNVDYQLGFIRKVK